MNPRAFLTFAAIGLVAGVTVAVAPGARAQTFPSEPITLIVAWPAGGGSDISMRLLADALSKQVKVPVVVLNKPGAGGSIGHREIANAKPDGYTIGMFSSGGIALPYLNAQANTIDELQPIAFFGEDPNALAGQHRQRHRIAQGICRARPRQSRQDHERQRSSRAARPSSPSRSTRR